jgi:hypothetical protein
VGRESEFSDWSADLMAFTTVFNLVVRFPLLVS